MLCEVCHKKKATVHFTEIVKNQMVKINLCAACAKQKGIDIYTKFSVSDLLSGLADLEGGKVFVEDRECAKCGMTSREFKDIGRFGCSECYLAFEEMINPLLEAIHKTSRHVGKVPKRWSKRSLSEVELKNLEDQLQKAIHSEAFEEAARIRDQIKDLKEVKRYKK
jgi:protein arginine kinase activator